MNVSVITAGVVIAAGIFFGAQHIAYSVSFEGKWQSCLKTFDPNKNSYKILMGQPNGGADPVFLCKGFLMGSVPGE